MKRTILTLLAISISFATGHAERPNIVFLFADDQRPDTIAAHGNEHIQTPHLDRLAANGLSFTSNYCAGSYSGAVCVASRSMLMTGRHWHRIDDTKDWEGLPTLPEQLGKAGYQTFAVGKWHNGLKTLARSFQAGRNLYMGGMADHTKTSVQDLLPNGELTEKKVGKRFSSTLFADAAIDFIESHSSDSPYFLYVSFTAPHDPRNPPPTYRKLYYDNRPPLPKNFLPDHPFDTGHLTGGKRDESLASHPRKRSDVSDQLCEYYGLITQLDSQVGRILDAIETSGQSEDTIIIYTADHGLAMGSHGLLGKQNLYEHSMGTPLIVSGPGVPKNRMTSAFTYILDLHKTILELSDTPITEDIDGVDLSPLFGNPNARTRDSVFLAFQDKMRAIRDMQYKLHVYPEINHKILFDLENDPNEMYNLADNPLYSDKVDELTELMKSWQRKVGDPSPLSVANPGPKEIDFRTVERTLDRWQPEWIREKYFDGRSDPDHGN
ncbi:MAG TPA: choline-sulfatase [Opitutae bacterium]|nr:choline-sulfatase [Opitutaceae bacterium]HCR30875.1 choline-sulfatase [Opitutae bacterium]